MRKDCRYRKQGDLFVCRWCGDEKPKVTRRNCPRPRYGLGDALSSLLEFFGITPERFERLTGRRCKCKERRDALNRITGA